MTCKRPFAFWFLGFVLLVFTAAAAGADEQKPQGGNAASVNGVNITEEDVNRQMFALEQHWLSSKGTAVRPDMVPVLRDRILDELIDQELLYQESRKQGLEVTDEAVDEEIEALRKGYPDEEAFKDGMRQMSFSEATLKLQMKKNLSIKKLVEKEILSKVRISDEDIKSFYGSHPDLFKEPERVRASHILIKSEADTDPAAKEERRKKLEAVKKRLDQGEDFAALAKEVSQCPSAEKGGDLGYFERGKMVKPFEDAAFSMKPGDVSDIVVSSFGFHIIKVTDKKPERRVPYDESREKIRQYLERTRFLEAKNSYVAELKKKGTVERF